VRFVLEKCNLKLWFWARYIGNNTGKSNDRKGKVIPVQAMQALRVARG
jgi:hypothetical protein